MALAETMLAVVNNVDNVIADNVLSLADNKPCKAHLYVKWVDNHLMSIYFLSSAHVQLCLIASLMAPVLC